MIRGWINSIAAASRRLRDSTRGGVALIGALSLTTLVGMGAFAVEATRGYATNTANQRIADMAALAGAMAYNVNSNPAQMIATAKAVVVAQGLAATAADVQLVTDPATSKQLVQVTVTTAVPLALGRVFTSAVSYDVSAVGSATTSTTTTSAPPCIAALSGTPAYGVSLNGGVSISAAGCTINTNAGVTIPNGTQITAKQVNAGKTIANGSPGIVTSPTPNNYVQNKVNAAADWMSGDATLAAALCKVNQLSGYSDPDYAGGNRTCATPLVSPTSYTNTSTEDWTTGYVLKTSGTPHQWQTADYSCQYNIPVGTYTIRKLSVNGGCSISFATGSTLKFDSIDLNGTMTVGNGDFTVVGAFNQNSDLTLGNGNHSFGQLNLSGGRTLTIGNGNFNLGGAISIGGGTKIYIDVGVGNTVTIGNNGSGTSINLGGGSLLCFTAASGSGCAAPTAAAGTFSVGGTAGGNIVTAGGSTLVFPKAMTHVVNGSLNSAGSMTFGSGTYFLMGSFNNGTGGVMGGTDVSFVMGGIFVLSGGTTLDLAAPTAASSYGLSGILFATKSSGASSMSAGAGGKYAGLLYAPRSDVNLSGGASMSASGGNCLMMIVNTLNLIEGGTTNTGACSALAATSATTANVALFK